MKTYTLEDVHRHLMEHYGDYEIEEFHLAFDDEDELNAHFGDCVVFSLKKKKETLPKGKGIYELIKENEKLRRAAENVWMFRNPWYERCPGTFERYPMDKLGEALND